MPAKSLIVSVDRVERGIAVAEADSGRRFEVPVARFPEKPTEGTVYRVPLSANGEPHWEKAHADHAETERRRTELGKRMARLRDRDPGGDIEL